MKRVFRSLFTVPGRVVSYLVFEYRRYGTERLAAQTFLSWAQSRAVEGVVVEVVLRTIQRRDVFVSGSWQPTTAPASAYFRLQDASVPVPEGLTELFRSDYFVVTERVAVGSLPCFGDFTPDEMALSTALITAVWHAPDAVTMPTSQPARWRFPATVDVVVWVRGELRGSIVVSAPTLGEALVRAAKGCLADGRFEPPTAVELQSATLEVRWLSSLQLPLPRYEGRRPRIEWWLAHVATSGSRIGWFVPTIFSTQAHQDRDQFLQHLAYDKAGIARRGPVSFWQTAVVGYVHTQGAGQARALYGAAIDRRAIALPNVITDTRISAMVAWLRGLQNTAGHWPRLVDVYAARGVGTDWVRSAMTAWSLGEYGMLVRDDESLQVAKRAAAHLTRHIDGLMVSTNLEKGLTHCYLARFWLACGDPEQAQVHFKQATTYYEGVAVPSLAALQYVAVGQALYPTEERVVTLRERLWTEWSDQVLPASASSVPLVQYGELLPIMHSLGDGARARQFATWLCAYQREDGSFPNTPVDPYTYTRGVGKLAEVLAAFPETREEAQRALSFVLTQQWCDEDVGFVRPEIWPSVRGGVRHDGADHRLWIDSVGHALIAAVRCLSRE